MIDLHDFPCMSFDYGQWNEYLECNEKNKLKIDFRSEPALDKKQRKLIFPSVKAFQTGEHSDGAVLMKAAERFAERINEPVYNDVTVRFIREENRHSSYLAQYLDYHGEPRRKSLPLDRIFRVLRQTGGIFMEISVLVTAEIIALSYYSALGNTAESIKSPALVSVCGQMLHDELRHIVLQSYTLSHLKNNLPERIFRKTLMAVTSGAVWIAYHRVMRSGGYSYRHFRGENFGYLRQSMELFES